MSCWPIINIQEVVGSAVNNDDDDDDNVDDDEEDDRSGGASFRKPPLFHTSFSNLWGESWCCPHLHSQVDNCLFAQVQGLCFK